MLESEGAAGWERGAKSPGILAARCCVYKCVSCLAASLFVVMFLFLFLLSSH